jgi:hypothetical protein
MGAYASLAPDGVAPARFVCPIAGIGLPALPRSGVIAVARREFGIHHLLLDGLDRTERDRKNGALRLDVAAASRTWLPTSGRIARPLAMPAP